MGCGPLFTNCLEKESSPKFDKKSVRKQPARMMHTGARACMLAYVQSGDPDLHPVSGSATPEVWKGVVSWQRGTSVHDPLPGAVGYGSGSDGSSWRSSV
jgi:hypothetical protein